MHEVYKTISQINQQIGDIRGIIGRLEAKADEGTRWIEAHRSRAFAIEQALETRCRTMEQRQDIADRERLEMRGGLTGLQAAMAELRPLPEWMRQQEAAKRQQLEFDQQRRDTRKEALALAHWAAVVIAVVLAAAKVIDPTVLKAALSALGIGR